MEINQKIYWTTDSYQTGMLWQLLNRLNSTVLRGLIFTTLWHITAAGNNRKLKLIVRYNRRDQRLFTKTNETRCKEIEVWETERWQKKETDREKIACVNLTRLDRFKACWMEITPLEANRTSVWFKIYSPKYTSFPQVGHFVILDEMKAKYCAQHLVQELHQNSRNFP